MGFCFATRGGSNALMAAAMAAVLAGCQTGDGSSALESAAAPKVEETVKASELLAFCPPVELREGTAVMTIYERGGDGDSNRVIYQASVSDVSRSCTYENGVGITVGVAGKIVPGPKGKAGTITLPIRVVLVEDGVVSSSKLYKHTVTVADTATATQFVFTEPGLTIPQLKNRRVLIYAGFDEGPPKKKTN